MNPKLVTFDCAQTLVEVNWSIGGFALECLGALGETAPDGAAGRYASLYIRRLPEFHEANLTGAKESVETFWVQLDADWLRDEGLPPNLAPQMVAMARTLAFSPESTLFRPYDDVLPCLEAIRGLGIKLAVISNWDQSLHEVLRHFGWYDYFEMVVASLEFGIEKPDPRIFLHVLEELGFDPTQALHVGDDPVDDWQGASSVGMRSVLIDRARSAASPPYINTLNHLREAFLWTD